MKPKCSNNINSGWFFRLGWNWNCGNNAFEEKHKLILPECSYFGWYCSGVYQAFLKIFREHKFIHFLTDTWLKATDSVFWQFTAESRLLISGERTNQNLIRLSSGRQAGSMDQSELWVEVNKIQQGHIILCQNVFVESVIYEKEQLCNHRPWGDCSKSSQ